RSPFRMNSGLFSAQPVIQGPASLPVAAFLVMSDLSNEIFHRHQCQRETGTVTGKGVTFPQSCLPKGGPAAVPVIESSPAFPNSLTADPNHVIQARSLRRVFRPRSFA